MVTVPNVVSTPVQAPKPVQKIITQPKRAPQKSVASKPYIPAQAAKPQVAPVPVTPVVENNNNEERELDLTKREFVMDIKPAENKATPSAPKKDSVDLDDDDLR